MLSDTLPAHLKALLRRATDGEVIDLSDKGLLTPVSTSVHTLIWGVLYFISGDREHALERLETVYKLEQETLAERLPESKPSFKTYPIPAGAKPKKCSSCGAEMFWTKTENNEKIPVTADGRSHFETCPDARTHSKKGKK